MKLRLRLRREIGKREILKLLFERSIKNLDLNNSTYIKQVDGQIRLKETTFACVESWNWETGSSKKRSCKELSRNWRIEKNLLRRNWSSKTRKNWRTEESIDCESDDGSNSGFTEQSKFLVRFKRILRSWNREQLWRDPRSWSNFYDSEFQDFATLRFWIAAKYTELYG